MTRLAALVVLAACGREAAAPAARPRPFTPKLVAVEPLADGVWRYTAMKTLPQIGPFPTSGLIVQTDDGPFLVDTAWDDAQTRELAAWTHATLGAPLAGVIVTHAHDDKMGGLGALHALGIPSYASRETNVAAPGRGLVPARHELGFHGGVEPLAGGALEAYHPGAGHTRDNIVVYVPRAKVLFGGCLIRPAATTSLGNTADADVAHWDVAVANVKAKYPAARIVVPSHGPPAGFELLDHTIAIARANR